MNRGAGLSHVQWQRNYGNIYAVTKENIIIADVEERAEVIDMHNKILACKLKNLVTCLIKDWLV